VKRRWYIAPARRQCITVLNPVGGAALATQRMTLGRLSIRTGSSLPHLTMRCRAFATYRVGDLIDRDPTTAKQVCDMAFDETRTALITGASRGLGLALARALAREHWRLVIDARHADALAVAERELAATTAVTALAGDISDATHRQALAHAVREAGGLDLLVNNASTLGTSPLPSLLDYPLDALERVLRVNTIAPLALLQAFAGALRPGARILNITSDAAVEGYPGWGGYGASKAALEQLTHVLAAERPEWRWYWVDPGDMRTAMHQEAFPGEDISDRPLPEESVPGLLALIEGDLPSGRYQARNLPHA
jgi:NAD(P)-dependent dehydrogenase (short-subunit alcohol dehydrogenase family)